MSIISGAELAAYLGIPDSQDDSRIATAAAATNRAVTRYCGRSFETVTTGSASARVFHPRTPTLCYTDDFWTTSSLTVKTDAGDDGTYETTLTIGSDFLVEPLNGIEDGLSVPYHRIIARAWNFPCHSTVPSVQVTAAWGWGSVPDEVKQAALIKAGALFRRKDSLEGILGGFQDFGAIRVGSREDRDVVALLRYYRTPQAQLLV